MLLTWRLSAYDSEDRGEWLHHEVLGSLESRAIDRDGEVSKSLGCAAYNFKDL